MACRIVDSMKMELSSIVSDSQYISSIQSRSTLRPILRLTLCLLPDSLITSLLANYRPISHTRKLLPFYVRSYITHNNIVMTKTIIALLAAYLW